MANTIKIKRRPASGAAGKPSSLFNGELAFNENDNILYYGYGSGVGGAASSIEQIGGTGYFAHRGGTNASGTWPISVTGNAETVTNGVYTTGDQTVNGLKTFGNTTTFNSGISAVAINTSSNSVGYFAVFDNNPNSSTQTLKSVSKDQILDDIGAATSGLDIIAGSGLVGGGTLSANRTFDIGQGDGISVSADSIAVDSTVVRSTSINVSGYIPTWAANSSKTLNTGYQVSTNLDTNNSSTFIPRADAVKTYVDNMIVSGIATNDAMIFKGAIDCSTNPNYPSGDRGWTYKVSVAGKIGGASGPAVEVNDTLICTTDGTSAGTHASVGSNWVILQTNIADASILVTGPTSATSGNIAMFDGSTGKIIKDGGFLISDIARLSASQTFTGTNSFAVINAGYQPTTDAAFIIYDDNNNITFRVMSGGSVTSGTWNATTIAADKGGTGQSSYAIGDLLYANTTTSLAKLANVATGNVLLAGGVSTAPSWGKVGLTTHVSGTLPVANGGTNQTSYTNGQLLIGNDTGNTLTKSTLTAGTSVDITNGNGSITIGHADTSTLTGAQGSNGIASITVDGLGHVTAVTTATYLTAGTVCAAIVDCSLDGGSF